MILLAIVLLVFSFLQLAPVEAPSAFRAIDVFVDTGDETLAAYQIEITCDDARAKIAGVEGGEDGAFAEPPYYDPAALQGGRIVLGAFTTVDDPPRGRLRVARLHVLEPGASLPDYTARLVTAAAPGGERITIEVQLERKEEAR